MRDVADIQRKLIALGFLPEHDAIGGPNVDGRFGGRTLEAANAYLTAIGAPRMSPPITKTHIAELLRLLFPEDYRTVAKPPSLFALLIAALPLLKGSPMTSDQLTGLLRTLLAAIAAYAAGKGWVPGVSPELIASIATAIVGVWSWISNRPKVIAPLGK